MDAPRPREPSSYLSFGSEGPADFNILSSIILCHLLQIAITSRAPWYRKRQPTTESKEMKSIEKKSIDEERCAILIPCCSKTTTEPWSVCAAGIALQKECGVWPSSLLEPSPLSYSLTIAMAPSCPRTSRGIAKRIFEDRQPLLWHIRRIGS